MQAGKLVGKIWKYLIFAFLRNEFPELKRVVVSGSLQGWICSDSRLGGVLAGTD